ncbi:hypothetical protein BG000_005514 [Podila horticola]|nr:hypothetical protein BG000_005514 [Podila horticola]
MKFTVVVLAALTIVGVAQSAAIPTEEKAMSGDWCAPLRIKFSSEPYTVVTCDDIYNDSSDIVIQESGSDSENAERNRIFQELNQYLSWTSESKTADLKVVY